MGYLFGALLAEAGVDELLVDVDEQFVEKISRDGVTVVEALGSDRVLAGVTYHSTTTRAPSVASHGGVPSSG
jgi:ketopantoate reductase